MSDLALTYEQAADAISVSVSTIERMVRAGELPTVSFRRAKRIPISDFEAYISENKIYNSCPTNKKILNTGRSAYPMGTVVKLADRLAQPISKKQKPSN